jgi:phosphatidylglycerol:prolipoprotein diacylglycerol transferase
VHPVFLQLGPLAIHTYGVLVALAFLFGLMWAARRAKRKGLDPAIVSDLGVWLILAAMVGAKLFHIIFCWDEFITAWRAEGLKSLREGFVFYGGFLGASVATAAFVRQRHVPLWPLADAFAPAVALGHVLGRLGCFFNGCCYGYPSDVALAVRFPTGHIMHSAPVHPTQLYEVAANLLILAGLLIWERRPRVAGQLWWLYVLAYGVARFAIEFWRGDYPTHWAGVLTAGHAVAAAMVLTAVVALTAQAKHRS